MQSFNINGLSIRLEKIFEVFTINGNGGNLGHASLTIYIDFLSRFKRRFHVKFDVDWPSHFRGEDVKNNVRYMYLAPGKGHTAPPPPPRGNLFLKKQLLSQFSPLL